MITVAIPTLGRPEHVRSCVDSILAGEVQPDDILVLDQSDDDKTRRALADLDGTVRYVHLDAAGASEARNAAAELASSEYVAFLDDDATVPPGWLAAAREELDAHGRPDALFGAIRAPDGAGDGRGLAVSTFPVERTRAWTRMTHPSRLGYGGHVILRRDSLLRIGGFDARLGPGTDCYGAEDIDLNFRLLRASARVVTSPRIWMVHHQWRSPDSVPRLLYRYNLGHSAFCMKHLLAGDSYPLRLIAAQALDDLRMLGSAVKRRSRLRARAALWRAAGTWHGLARGWSVFKRG